MRGSHVLLVYQGTLESLLWVTRHLGMMQQVSVYEFVVNGVNCFGLVCVSN